jgi:glycosyltransferase involved in cell wall biosynthesis
MKIALCLEYPLRLRGGVGVIVENLAAQLSRSGHRIVLVSPDTQEMLRGMESANFFTEHLYWDPQNYSVANAKNLARQLVALKPDVVHFHAGGTYGWSNRFPFHSPIYYVSRAGIPTLWTSHRAESLLDGFCGPQKPLLFKLMLLPLAWLGKIQQVWSSRFEIAVSQDNFQKIRRWYWPCRSRFVRIYHSRLRQTPLVKETTTREPLILCVGHLAEVKGQTVLVEAFSQIAKKHPQFNLALVGHPGTDGTSADIQKTIQKHQLEKRVLLLGERMDTELWMQRAAIYVQPSLNEAFGLALQEAMFYGCPVIGSRVGGIPELIRDSQTGILAAPGNVADLCSALERYIQEPQFASQCGAAAASSIRERGMTIESMARRYLDLYETAAARA